MKYVRTKNGTIADVEKFINEEKDTPYYKDFEFEEISKDGQLKWTAVGTEQNSMKEQRGIRCHFSATLDSEIVKQADTIEELCDYELHYNSENELVIRKCKDVNFNILKSNLKSGYIKDVKLAILTDKGLIYVAKMNKKGELELL